MADLFAISETASASFDSVDGRIPLLLVDGLFTSPLQVRETALDLPYSPGTAHYPGRVARYPAGDPALTGFLRTMTNMVTDQYLPRMPPIPGMPWPPKLRGVDTDFAITDRHPGELSPEQRKPHVDFVPVFGLVYLNEEERGGTVFFKPKVANPTMDGLKGYPTRANDQLDVCGRIEGRFNRLAIYPGFILHSADIEGDWIEGPKRFEAPRLTQRIMFFF